MSQFSCKLGGGTWPGLECQGPAVTVGPTGKHPSLQMMGKQDVCAKQLSFLVVECSLEISRGVFF